MEVKVFFEKIESGFQNLFIREIIFGEKKNKLNRHE